MRRLVYCLCEINPFILTLTLTAASLFILILSILYLNKWAGFAIALFYLGGIIILFIYLVSLVTIEKIKFESLMKKLSVLAFLLLLRYLVNFTDVNLIFFNITSVYNISSIISPGLGAALFVGLISVIQIVEFNKGPIKPSRNE